MDSQQAPIYPRLRYSGIWSILNSGNNKLQILQTSLGRYAVNSNDGDRIFIDIICKGDETKLEITSLQGTNKGIWDLYVNGILDSAGYDDYIATPGDINREITLSRPVQVGNNSLELRVNDKNFASSGWRVQVAGASIQ